MYAVAVRSLPGGNAQVTHAAHAPLPPDAIRPDGVVQAPHLLGAALRGMLEQNKIPIHTAVMGLPSRAVATRSINIPPVPPKVRREMVRGEIEHLNALPPGRGAFAFAPLAKPTGAVDAPAAKGEPILFFAAEHDIVESYRAAAEHAGLRLVGLEPSAFAAIRTIYPSLVSAPLSLAISLGTAHTDLLFVQNGAPIYARRLDSASSK
jgi:Tfp pilus assembly PilM family ATPase